MPDTSTSPSAALRTVDEDALDNELAPEKSEAAEEHVKTNNDSGRSPQCWLGCQRYGVESYMRRNRGQTMALLRGASLVGGLLEDFLVYRRIELDRIVFGAA